MSLCLHSSRFLFEPFGVRLKRGNVFSYCLLMSLNTSSGCTRCCGKVQRWTVPRVLRRISFEQWSLSTARRPNSLLPVHMQPVFFVLSAVVDVFVCPSRGCTSGPASMFSFCHSDFQFSAASRECNVPSTGLLSAAKSGRILGHYRKQSFADRFVDLLIRFKYHFISVFAALKTSNIFCVPPPAHGNNYLAWGRRVLTSIDLLLRSCAQRGCFTTLTRAKSRNQRPFDKCRQIHATRRGIQFCKG